MFQKVSAQVNELSKDDVQFIIQKKTAENPVFMQSQFKSNFLDSINGLKEDFGIEEKKEFAID